MTEISGFSEEPLEKINKDELISVTQDLYQMIITSCRTQFTKYLMN